MAGDPLNASPFLEFFASPVPSTARFNIRADISPDVADVTVPIVVGTEATIALRRTGNFFEGFVDGVLAGSDTLAAVFTVNKIRWGRAVRDGASNNFDGGVFWSSINDRALNDTELAAQAATPNPYL